MQQRSTKSKRGRKPIDRTEPYARIARHRDRLGQVADRDVATLAGVPAWMVAEYRKRHDIAAFRGWPRRRRRRAVPEPRPEQAPLRWDERLPELPDRLLVLLEQAGVRTLQELLALDVDGPLEDVQARVRVSFADEQPRRSLREVAKVLLGSIRPTDRTILELRFVQGAKLEDIGAAIGFTSENARQRLLRMAKRIPVDLQLQARRLLFDRPPVGSDRALVVGDCGLAPDEIRKILWLVTKERWRKVAPGVFWRGDVTALEPLLDALRQQTYGLTGLGAADVTDLAERLEVSPELVRPLLVKLGWRPDGDELVLDEDELSDRDWLVLRVLDAGRPVHVDELAERWMARDGVAAGPSLYGRRLAGILNRHPDVVRCGPRTYTHRDNLAIWAEDLDRIVDWCVQRLRDERDAWAARVLLEELEASGFDVSELNPAILISVLAAHPDIVTLRGLRVGHVQVVGRG